MQDSALLTLQDEITFAVLLGILEGLTEFLPVSSTAHLRFAQATLGISLESSFWKLFAVWIQLGAILALVWVYRKKMLELWLSAWEVRHSLEKLKLHPIYFIGISFVVTAVPAFLMKKTIGKNLESQTLMANALWVGGLAMILLEIWTLRTGPKLNDLFQIKSRQAIFVGLAQIISAVIPGTSRSMVTIAAGQLSGMSRPLALDYSFWVSIPIMIVACSYDLLKTLSTPSTTATGNVLAQREWILLFVGLFVSFLVAWIVILGFLRWVKKHGMLPFAIYRVVAGIWLLSHL